MSVSIKVIGSSPESDEYQGALKLKRILLSEFPSSVTGEIVLYANVTLIGQTVKDVDLMMLGSVQGYQSAFSFYNQSEDYVRENVAISNFCTTIEIKSHNARAVSREGTELYVKYGDKLHSVTHQSNQQKISAKNFFQYMTGWSPFITNLIWFTNVSRGELKNLLSMGEKEFLSNALCDTFSLHELMQLLIWQRPPRFSRNQYFYNSVEMGRSVLELEKVFHTFSSAQKGMGDLTRKRIEQLTRKDIESSIKDPEQGKMAIYRGRAGTGKTVGLIRLAIKLVDDYGARVQILTYNKALVSDIRRLFTLAELPDMFEVACVSINTMQSFFYKIANSVLYDEKLDGNVYLQKYNSIIQDLLDFISEDADSLDFVKDIMEKNEYLKWDYCLVDEAQDWTAAERDLILRLFGSDHVVVADGGQQFVRGLQACNWSIVPQRQNIKLKYCLRQKSNLISFLNHFIAAMGVNGNKIIDANRLQGGHVRICHGTNTFFEICKSELESLKETGNIPYDMLFLTPAQYVEKTETAHHFKYVKEFEKRGFLLWDGTNEEKRSAFSVLGDEERMLQYDSARGLEAWSVACIGFDVFVEEKMGWFKKENNPDQLLLESEEEQRNKYILNWMLIPLTRAIDNIVIEIKDLDSQVGRILRSLADEYPDYIEFEEI